MSLVGYSPLGQFMLRAFDQMFNDDIFNNRNDFWRDVPYESFFDVGSALGGVANSRDKFAISLNASHFKLEELKVNVNGSELTIEGKQEERDGQRGGTIKRSFVRKFRLPEDTNMDSLRSSLSDKGRLTIEAPKKTQDTTKSRAIPITCETEKEEEASSGGCPHM